VLNRLPNHPQPVAPIYQPEVVARAILHAAEHPRRREYWVGGSTVGTLRGDKFAPGLLDRYLARTGYRAQQSERPADPNAPVNLWSPADGPGGRDLLLLARRVASHPASSAARIRDALSRPSCPRRQQAPLGRTRSRPEAAPEEVVVVVVVVRIDPQTNQAVETVAVGGHPIDVAVTAGAVWVSVANPGALLRIAGR
jgi:hypothetical protein